MGTAVVNLKTGKRLEHNGIKVELIGQLGESVAIL